MEHDELGNPLTVATKFIKGLESDIAHAWGNLSGEAVKDAHIAWIAIRTVMLAILPGQWKILNDLVRQALKDITDGDLGNLETDILNLAEKEELAWIKEVGSEVLTVVVSLIKLQQTGRA